MTSLEVFLFFALVITLMEVFRRSRMAAREKDALNRAAYNITSELSPAPSDALSGARVAPVSSKKDPASSNASRIKKKFLRTFKIKNKANKASTSPTRIDTRPKDGAGAHAYVPPQTNPEAEVGVTSASDKPWVTMKPQEKASSPIGESASFPNVV